MDIPDNYVQNTLDKQKVGPAPASERAARIERESSRSFPKDFDHETTAGAARFPLAPFSAFSRSLAARLLLCPDDGPG